MRRVEVDEHALCKDEGGQCRVEQLEQARSDAGREIAEVAGDEGVHGREKRCAALCCTRVSGGKDGDDFSRRMRIVHFGQERSRKCAQMVTSSPSSSARSFFCRMSIAFFVVASGKSTSM